MQASNWAGMAVRALFVLHLPVFGQAGGNSLRIHIYNLAGISRTGLDTACDDAARVLADAGLQTIWQTRRADEPEAHTLDLTSGIATDNRDSRQYLVVRFVRGLPDTAFPGALAFALPQATFGAHITILYDRVERLSPPSPAAGAAILAHILVHEIGHVLLDSADHSRTGVMKDRWGDRDFRLAETGQLAFTRDESARLREGARQRLHVYANREQHPRSRLARSSRVDSRGNRTTRAPNAYSKQDAL